MSNEAETVKKSQRALTPKLRFPEFRKEPGWKPRSLSALLDYEQPSKYIVEDSNYQDTGTPVLTANKSFVLGHTAETTGIFEDVPVIIFDDFTTDKKYVDFPFKVKSSAIKILLSRGNDELKLIYELMSRIRFDSTQHKRYYISQYQDLEIALPSPPEQQKIAECLSSLDGLIAAEGRMLEALKAHKKGLMQQLFPGTPTSPSAGGIGAGADAGAPRQPRLRFPEFRDKGEWEEKPLGELVIFASGGTPSKTDPKFWDGDIPWISASAMHDTAVYDSELRVTQEAIGNGTRLAEKGSILILVRGSMLFKRVPICIAKRDVAFNQDVKSIRPKRSVVTRYLLNHLIASESRIAINSTGIGAGKIDTEHLKSLIIGIPSSPEQQRIADCLTTLDTRIAAQAVKINALKQHKRGLMQQLFPAPEEVNA